MRRRFSVIWLYGIIAIFAGGALEVFATRSLGGGVFYTIGEAFFLFLMLICMWPACSASFFRWAGIGVFVAIYCVAIVLINGGELAVFDGARALKPWLYLVLFCFVSENRFVRFFDLSYFINASLIVAFISYSINALIFSYNRPIMMAENNFEIPMFVSFWLAGVLRGCYSFRSWQSAVLVYVVAISLSRSGVISVTATMGLYLLVSQIFGREKRRIFDIFFGTFVAIIIVFFVVYSRDYDGADSLDRVVFFRSFADVMSSKNLFQIMFGSGPFVELPYWVCLDLAYYWSLLSGVGGECLSVIWHGFFLRFLNDYGLIGLLFFYGTLYMKIYSRHGGIKSFLVLSPSLAAAVSVGGLYNFMSFLGVFICYISLSENYRSSDSSC